MANSSKSPDERSSKIAAVRELLTLLGRPWFAHAPDIDIDHHTARLLFAIYLASEEGTPLSKKAALNFVDLETKTARKYLARAIELRLVDFVQSADDRRVDLLHPSSRLKGLIEAELSDLTAGISEKKTSRAILRFKKERPRTLKNSSRTPAEYSPRKRLREYSTPKNEIQSVRSLPKNLGNRGGSKK